MGVPLSEQFDWTDERTALLRRRWDDGASASVIGAELGLTRGAVLGKVYRLKLSPRRKSIPRPRNARTAESPRRSGRPAATWRKAFASPPPPGAHAARHQPEVAVVKPQRDILRLTKPTWRLSMGTRKRIVLDYTTTRENVVEIAQRWGVTHGYVSILAKRAGEPLRRPRR